MAKQKKIKRSKVSFRSEVKKQFSSSSVAGPNSGRFDCKDEDACEVDLCDSGRSEVNSCSKGPKSASCEYCLKNNFKSSYYDLVSENNYQNLNYFGKIKGKNDSPLLISAYNCSLQNEPCDRNEITILALGIKQYMKEVFTHLDSSKNGCLTIREIKLLCKVLGKSCVIDHDASNPCSINDPLKCWNIQCSTHIHFEKFYQLMGKSFSDIAPISFNKIDSNSKLVNAVINISRRNNILCQINESLQNIDREVEKVNENRRIFLKKKSKNFNAKSLFHLDKNKASPNENISAAAEGSLEHLNLQKKVLIQQQEINCLRELVEDLRTSLQSSDAENLSLKVKLEGQNDQLIQTISALTKTTCELPNISPGSSDLSESNGYQTDSIESFLELLSSYSNSSSEDCQLKTKEDKIIKENVYEGKEEANENNMGAFLTKESTKTMSKNAKQTFPSNIFDFDLEIKNKHPAKKLGFFGQNETDFDNDLHQMFDKLYESQITLENTRQDLESTALQVRERDLKLKCLFQVARSMKSNWIISESKSFRLRRQFDQMKIAFFNERENSRKAFLEKEKAKEEANWRSLQLDKLHRQLTSVTASRNSDLAKMKMIRELLTHCLSLLTHNGIRPPYSKKSWELIKTPIIDDVTRDSLQKNKFNLSSRLQANCGEEDFKVLHQNSTSFCEKNEFEVDDHTENQSEKTVFIKKENVSSYEKIPEPPNRKIFSKNQPPKESFNEDILPDYSLTWDPSWSRSRSIPISRSKLNSRSNSNNFTTIFEGIIQTNPEISKSTDSYFVDSPQDKMASASSKIILEGIEAEIDELRRTLDLESPGV